MRSNTNLSPWNRRATAISRRSTRSRSSRRCRVSFDTAHSTSDQKLRQVLHHSFTAGEREGGGVGNVPA